MARASWFGEVKGVIPRLFDITRGFANQAISPGIRSAQSRPVEQRIQNVHWPFHWKNLKNNELK
jgi:hypothetical protein